METRLENAWNQKMFAAQAEEEQGMDQEQGNKRDNDREEFHLDTSVKDDILYKKFEHLALFVSKDKPKTSRRQAEDKPKKSIQGIKCHEYTKQRRYASQCQVVGSTTKLCGYCARLLQMDAACYNKEVDEARKKSDEERIKEILPKTILMNGFQQELKESQKSVMFVQEEVLTKQLVTGEPPQKQSRVEEPVLGDTRKTAAAASIR